MSAKPQPHRSKQKSADNLRGCVALQQLVHREHAPHLAAGVHPAIHQLGPLGVAGVCASVCVCVLCGCAREEPFPIPFNEQNLRYKTRNLDLS
jgi:hypothetical protein